MKIYQKALLSFLYRAGHPDAVAKISKAKKQGKLVELITDRTSQELREYINIKNLEFSSDNDWSNYVHDIQEICVDNPASVSSVLGIVMEIMEELDWQNHLKLREFLTLLIDDSTEYAHFKLAISGTKLRHLEDIHENMFEHAKLKAIAKSKIQ